MQTHLEEVCSSRSSSRRKCVLLARRGEQIQQGRKSENWSKVSIIAVKGPMVVVSAGASMFQVNASKLRRPLDTVEL